MNRLSCCLLILLIAAGLGSCFKKDSAVPAPERGNVLVDTIAMTSSYLYQVYFRLDSGLVMATDKRTDSDLGFECSAEGFHIILNTADLMRIADMGVRTFGEAVDTAGVHWKFDKSDGNPDSIATGRWFNVSGTDTVSNGHVWALDLGRDTAGISLGMRQLIFDSLKHGTYYFRTAEIKGGNIKPGSVNKDPTVNYLYFGIREGNKVMPLEPPKNKYDLVFTQYTTLLYTDQGAAYPYLVTGVLSNPDGLMVAADTVNVFSSIDLALARTLNYSIAEDVIGYDWKTYSFSADAYTVRTNLSYVIRNSQGYYYKLRFISFYKAGVKGYPVIETQRL